MNSVLGYLALDQYKHWPEGFQIFVGEVLMPSSPRRQSDCLESTLIKILYSVYTQFMTNLFLQ